MQWEQDPLAGFERFELPNGLEVFTKTYDGCPFETVEFVIHAGSARDLENKEGSAHFLEHLPAGSVPGMKPSDVLQYFQSIGGACNLGRTELSVTKYGFFSPIYCMKKSLGIFESMIPALKFNDATIEHERRIILQEMTRRNPVNRLRSQRRDANLYRGHRLQSLASNILGTSRTLNDIKRADLEMYYESYYCPRNMTVVAVGGLPTTELEILLLTSQFAVPPSGERSSEFPIFFGPKTVEENLWSFRMSEVGGPKIEYIEYSSYGVVPNVFPAEYLMVTSSILSELLFKKIREDLTLAYHIYSDFEFLPGHYVLEIEGKLNLEAHNKIVHLVEELIKSIDEEIFARHKQRKIADARFQDLALGDIKGVAAKQVSQLRRISPMKEVIDTFEGMSFKHLQDILEYIPFDRRFTELVSP